MRRPSFQFYPADWNTNSNLLRCSWAAQGAWIRVMCLLHDSDEYGILRWTLKEIAQAIGAPQKLLAELAEKGVMKGADKGRVSAFIYVPRSGRKNGDPVTLIPEQGGPIWYSSRMVRDEYVRQIRGNGGEQSQASKPSPKHTKGEDIGESFGPRTRARSSSSSSSSSPTVTDTANAASVTCAPEREQRQQPASRIPAKAPIPENWWPSETDLAFVQQQTAFNPWPQSKLERVIHDFVAYYRSRGHVSADWSADFRRWVLKQPRFEQHDNAGPDESGYTDPFLQACAREVRAGRLSRGG